ncbi:MAG: hypothetical protein JNM27_15465 [Leptospirales bacterium]|nr:hypothetical protein [Leptospirales bacterium]
MRVSKWIMQALVLTRRDGSYRSQSASNDVELIPILEYLPSELVRVIPPEFENQEVTLPSSSNSPGEFEARVNHIAKGLGISANLVLWNLLSPEQKQWCQLELQIGPNRRDKRKQRSRTVTVVDASSGSQGRRGSTWNWNLIGFAIQSETQFQLDLEPQSALLDADQWFAQTARKTAQARKTVIACDGNQPLLHVKDALLSKHEQYLENRPGFASGLILRIHFSGQNITGSSGRVITEGDRMTS